MLACARHQIIRQQSTEETSIKTVTCHFVYNQYTYIHLAYKQGDQIGQNVSNLGYFLKAQAIFWGKYGLLWVF
jgi:hypothetical protein